MNPRLDQTAVPPGRDAARADSSARVSAIVAALEEAYAALRRRWPELPDVAMTVFHDRRRTVRGYFWEAQWKRPAGTLPELHIDSTILNEPPEAILKTLVHEAAHGLARARGLRDTSRDGRYHNRRFAEVAGELGLVVVPDRRTGRRTPGLHPEWQAGAYAPLIARIAHASGQLWQGRGVEARPVAATGNGGGPARPAAGRLLRATCACEPPRIIRIARATLGAAPIACGGCGSPFEAADRFAPPHRETGESHVEPHRASHVDGQLPR